MCFTVTLPTIPLYFHHNISRHSCYVTQFFTAKTIVETRQVLKWQCGARRRVIRYDDEQDNQDEEEETNGYNEEISLLEAYTLSTKYEVLIVHALVDEEKVEVLIFKGFSSCLSYETSADPTKSVLPKGAVISSIDRITGPFDPNNIQYIEKGLTLDAFKNQIGGGL